jgi:hypothetical protein
LPTTSDYSAASVLAAFRGLTNFQYPFDGGISLTCNGKQISFVPAACSSLASLGKFQDGKVTSLGNVDYSSVFN